MFDFNDAIKLPFLFFGRVRFTNLKGEVVLEAPIKRGMVGIGQKFEMLTKSRGGSEVCIRGKLVIKGHAHIGRDCSIYIARGAYCEFGNMTCLGSNVKLLCSEKIVLGQWARIGYESQIVDTNSHQMKNTITDELYKKTNPIHIGNFNSVSTRVSIMPGTRLPDYCVVASNSLCTSDYTNFGSNILLGGVPIKLLKENYGRDWEGEKERMIQHLVKKHIFK